MNMYIGAARTRRGGARAASGQIFSASRRGVCESGLGSQADSECRCVGVLPGRLGPGRSGWADSGRRFSAGWLCGALAREGGGMRALNALMPPPRGTNAIASGGRKTKRLERLEPLSSCQCGKRGAAARQVAYQR